MKSALYLGVHFLGALFLSGCASVRSVSSAPGLATCAESHADKVYQTQYGTGYAEGEGIVCARSYETYLAYKDTLPLDTEPDWYNWCSTPYEERVHRYGVTYVRRHHPYCATVLAPRRGALYPWGMYYAPF